MNEPSKYYDEWKKLEKKKPQIVRFYLHDMSRIRIL